MGVQTHLNLVHELHGLNDTDSLALADLVPLLAEGGLPGGGGPVETACHWAGHLHSTPCFHASLTQSDLCLLCL